MGRGFAAVGWVLFPLIPLVKACRYKRGKETLWERIALFALSGTILFALYGVTHPRLFLPDAAAFAQDIKEKLTWVKALFGGSVWGMLILYLILYFLRLFLQGGKDQRFRYGRTVLCVLCVSLSVAAAISLAEGCLPLLEPWLSGIDRGFGAVLVLKKVLPYLFDTAILFRLLALLEVAEQGELAGVARSAAGVSRICCLALGITTAVTAAANLLQVAVMHWLSNISVTVDIPIVSMAFTVMVLLFSHLLVENKELREDNELFI